MIDWRRTIRIINLIDQLRSKIVIPSFRLSLLAVLAISLYRNDVDVLSRFDVVCFLMLIGVLSILDNIRVWFMLRYQIDRD
jgi:energy-converting hydrogenase Eha subunit G